MLSRAFDLIYNKVEGWFIYAAEMLPNFFVAIFIVLVFSYIAKYTKKITSNIIAKFSDSPAVVRLTSNLISFTVITIGFFLALGVLDLQKTVTSLLAGVGILGLALGFAFQEIATNFICGVIISLRKPFKIGDVVDLNTIFGVVEDITLRTTNVRSYDGQKIYVPNKDVFQTAIINYTENGLRRIQLDVGISYGEDLEKVEKIVLSAVKDLDLILKDKPIDFFYTGFGDSSIDFTIMFWINYTNAHKEFFQLKHDAIKSIKRAFDQSDITIPFPIRTLDFGIKGGETFYQSLDKSRLNQK